MSGPATEPDELSPLARLVAECVRRLEERGPSGVDELCAQHPDLAPELRRRLAALEETGLVGRGRVGDYVLLRPLGRGGMGVVHLARDSRDGRVVALKALPGRLLQSDAARERFRREAQAVQALRHPGIVPLYEAGESDGVPWFTMEWIDGRTLADVIAALSALELAAERLDSSHLVEAAGTTPPADGAGGDGRGRAWVETVCRLVLDVAEALQYAHEHGVIHRDVKPGNILVGRDGKARLFDFGLARLDDTTRMTLSGDFAGTPAYAAPEQARGSTQALDGRADVYALGVTMYELLTLVLPPDATSASAPVAPRRLNATVGRDVETICLTALERDRGRRYASAAVFASDLRAALERRPIVARGPRWPRRVARWAARNRGAALAIALLLLLLVGAPVGLAVANARIREQAEVAKAQERAADRQRERASAEADRAHRALEFLYHLLAAPSPLLSGHDVKVRDLLDGAAAKAPRELADDPRALVDTLTTIGLCYFHLAEYEAAETQLRAAVALCRASTDGSLEPGLILALNGIAAVATETGRLEEAEAAGREALALAEKQGGGHDVATARTLASLGIVAVRRGDKPAALPLFRQALELQRAQPEPDPVEIATTMINLAAALDTGEPVEAEALLRESIETLRPQGGQRLAGALHNLSMLLLRAGRVEEAVAMERESIGIATAAGGSDHPDVAASRVMLAVMLESSGDRAAQIELLESALPALRALGAAGEQRLAVALNLLGWALIQADRAADAEAPLTESLALRRKNEGPASVPVAQSAGNLASAFRAQKRHDDAIAVLEQLLADAEQADASIRQALRAECLQELVSIAEEAGQTERAAEWRALLEHDATGEDAGDAAPR